MLERKAKKNNATQKESNCFMFTKRQFAFDFWRLTRNYISGQLKQARAYQLQDLAIQLKMFKMILNPIDW